jgi:hypothetical protein
MSFGLNEIQVQDTNKGFIISVWIMGKYAHTEFNKTQTDVNNYMNNGYTTRPGNRRD